MTRVIGGSIWRYAPFVLCVALYWPVLAQHLLSDDMSVAYQLHQWQVKGELWPKLWSKFATGLDSPSFYYRPLTFLSFGINYVVSGVSPLSWHLVNLVGHLLAGAAVFRIVVLLQSLRGVATDSVGAPVAAASLFLLWGTNAEPVAWVSGRYDVFATMLGLWACAFYLQARSAFDVRAMVALLLGALALCSKESAAVVPGLIGCFAWIRHGSKPFNARWRAIVADLLPWIALIAAYFALRTAIFGNPFQVYPEARPIERIAAGAWTTTLDAAMPWLNAAVPSRGALTLTGVLLVLVMFASVAAALRDRFAGRLFVGLAAAIAGTLALLLPHLSGLSPNGEGGRLFYTTGAVTAIWLSLPLMGSSWGHRSARPSRLLSIAMVVLVAAQAVLLQAALRDWVRAGDQMGRIVIELRSLAGRLDAGRYALIFAPDAIGSAPFIRNANGAMVLPPVQPTPMLNRMLIFRPSDAGELPPVIAKRMIPLLKTTTLEDSIAKMGDPDPSEDPASLWPTDILCWDGGTGTLKTVTLAEPWRNAERWVPAVQEGLRGAGCS